MLRGSLCYYSTTSTPPHRSSPRAPPHAPRDLARARGNGHGSPRGTPRPLRRRHPRLRAGSPMVRWSLSAHARPSSPFSTARRSAYRLPIRVAHHCAKSRLRSHRVAGHSPGVCHLLSQRRIVGPVHCPRRGSSCRGPTATIGDSALTAASSASASFTTALECAAKTVAPAGSNIHTYIHRGPFTHAWTRQAR